MNFRTAHLIKVILYVLACAVALVVFFGQLSQSLKWILLAIAVVLLIGGSVVNAQFCRCPHCGALLPAKWRLPRTCPNCNEEL